MSKNMQYRYSLSNTENGFLLMESAYEKGKQYDDNGYFGGKDSTYVFSTKDEVTNWLRDNGFAKQEEAQVKE